MLSRVANAIYWMNRYVERAENIARFVDVNLYLSLDNPLDMPQQWQPIVITTGDLDLFEQRYGVASETNVIQFLTFDRAYPNSIVSCLQMARENARSIREVISSEMWEHLNDFYLMVQDYATSEDSTDWGGFFAQVKMASHTFSGVANATMSHNEGWHFGRIGKLLERADKTARILDVKYFILLPSVRDVGTSLEELQWISLLKSTSAYEMYRKTQQRIAPERVAEFLILDREFPRSILFCLLEAEKSLHWISGNGLGHWCNPAERELGKLRSELEFITLEEIVDRGLHEFLDGMQLSLNQAGDFVSKTFFEHSAGEVVGSGRVGQ
jgi:uncharacterized alpha-E superfamily protein